MTAFHFSAAVGSALLALLLLLAGADVAPMASDPTSDASMSYSPAAAIAADMASLDVGKDDWPMWGRSRLRNGVAVADQIPSEWTIGDDVLVSPRPNIRLREPRTSRHIKWTAELGSQTYGNPIVANGRVFVGTNNGSRYIQRFPPRPSPGGVDLGCLLAFDEQTGQFLWQHSSCKLPTGLVHDWPDVGMCASLVVDGDRLWVVTNRCEVVCLDTEGFYDQENYGPFQAEVNASTDESDVVWGAGHDRRAGGLATQHESLLAADRRRPVVRLHLERRG